MTERKPPAVRGLARVTFRANLATVRAELEQGWTAKAIFDRHRAKLGSMSYRQFCRYVADELDHPTPTSPAKQVAEPLRPKPASTAVAADHGRAPPSTPASSPEGPANAGHKQPARTFEHDPIERPGDYERIFGEPRQPKK